MHGLDNHDDLEDLEDLEGLERRGVTTPVCRPSAGMRIEARVARPTGVSCIKSW
jgi:hypothetical protein